MDELEIYQGLYPGRFNGSAPTEPIVGYTLREVRINPVHSNVEPHEVDLTTSIGPVKLNLPLLSAAMDTVTGPDMAKAMFEIGGCGIIYRTKKPEQQLEWLKQSLRHRPCLVSEPKCLFPTDAVEDAKDILDQFDFSTIPVVTKRGGLLEGILFTRDVFFKVKGRMAEPVSNWMTPFKELKTESARASFRKIRDRLLNEQECSVLPIISSRRKLKGIYFMKDFFQVNPVLHNRKPLVGMAIGMHESDLDRVKEGIKLGVGIVVIDSSHGNCRAVIEQTEKVVKIAKGKAAVIAGNVADIGGYLNLAAVGVDGVKCGIGSGSICTTSQVTGAGVPMFTLIRELAFARQKLLTDKKNAPVIIPDGGINGPGDMVVALAAGGDVCMAGEWLVAAQESRSAMEKGVVDSMVFYRGMASKSAIAERLSERYGRQKKAPEGIETKVPFRGPLKTWIGKDFELVQGGFAHAGAKNIKELHRFGNLPMAFRGFTAAGQRQIVKLND